MEKMTTASSGRIAYGLAIIIFGVLHFPYAEALLDLIPSYMPFGPWFWVYFVGVAMIAAGLSILIRRLDRIACILLGTMFLLFIIMVRLPYVFGKDDEKRKFYLIEMSKELALAGSAFVIAGINKKSAGKA